MAPLSKATLLARVSENLDQMLTDLAEHRVEWTPAFHQRLITQYDTLKYVRQWADFTSANSYVGQRAMRIHLYNTAQSLARYETTLLDNILILEVNPTDTVARTNIVLIALAIKSVKLAPSLPQLAEGKDETIEEALIDE